MSRSGHPTYLPEAPSSALVVGNFDLGRGQWFPWHEHPVHQLAWAEHGLLTVRTEVSTWVLPPSLALWIPEGTPHATGATAPSHMRSPYIWPEHSPVAWPEPTVIAVSGLLRELIKYLALESPGDQPRRRAEAVLLDLLTPVDVRTLRIRLPSDPRARQVAEALLREPSDPRTLDNWAKEVAASSRTLARLFHSETGFSFSRWRKHARLQAALPMLAQGVPVATVAHRVGYATPSAFGAAFRSGLGVSPAAFFSRQSGENG
jgi:AraC-like DNA-binding protein/quercetin dioxygenase-like cupin family protein